MGVALELHHQVDLIADAADKILEGIFSVLRGGAVRAVTGLIISLAEPGISGPGHLSKALLCNDGTGSVL